MNEHLRIPLFPLPLVLLPSETLPLHIFEQRYREMIDDIRDSDIPFGIVRQSPIERYSVGCTANLEDILSVFEDGRLNIVVRGNSRFTILDEYNDRSYQEALVEILPDFDTDHQACASIAAQLIERICEYIKLSGKSVDSDALAALPFEQLLTFATHAIPIPLGEKQAILEERDASLRLKSVTDACQSKISHTKMIIAASNALGGIDVTKMLN